MTIKSTLATLTLCAGVTVLSACKKEEPPPAPQAPTASESAAPAAAAAMGMVTSAVKEVTSQAATQVQATESQVQAADSQVQTLIDKAKTLVADKKYSDALGSLNQLAGAKLTSEQQSLVDSLKAQIQAALAKATTGDAASALGGALGGKK